MRRLLLVLVFAGCAAEGLSADDETGEPVQQEWVQQTWRFTSSCPADVSVALKTEAGTSIGIVPSPAPWYVPAGSTLTLQSFCTAGNHVCATSPTGDMLSCATCAAGVLPAVAVPCYVK